VGNTPMDQLLVNLKLLSWIDNDLSALTDYCEKTSEGTGVPIPVNYPVVGADAFRTGTGVHAAAIAKARKKGHAWLADRIYSGVPASDYGLAQKIEVSHVSGISNVKWWLEAHGHDANDAALCQRLLDAAKATSRTLRDDELAALVAEHARRPVRA